MKWTDWEIKFLMENYKYKNKEDLLKNLNHPLYSIQVKASKLNLTGIPINEDFFKEWNKEMAWTFGLWIADGNMAKNNNRIGFSSNDYNMLEIVKYNLKSEHKIEKHGENGYQLRFSNKIMYDDLIKLGGIPRKSLTIQFPEVPDEFLPHLIRGYLDGDGGNYIRENKYLITSFTGNIDFLSSLKDKIREYAGFETCKLYPCGEKCNPRIKQLRYNGKKAIKLCDYIYQDSENLRLERKFEKYDQMKKVEFEKYKRR